MPNTSTRIFIDQPLLTGALIALDESRAHYLLHVMRKKTGDAIAVFNAESGEWRAEIESAGKRGCRVLVKDFLSPPRPTPDVWLAFSMLKNKSELVVEKATELGVSRLLPVVTQHAVVKSINGEKLYAHAIEAAEQCERHDVPAITPYDNLAKLLGDWPADRPLLYGDESGGGENLSVVLSEAPRGIGVLIGPEGGFSADEHRMLKAFAPAQPFGMGPRILRADTAAAAALACVQMVVGDWYQKPHFKGAV